MKFSVRYQSRGGNTRAIAEIIADSLGIMAETIETPLDEKTDILFIGGGVYKWHIDTKLKECLENLNPEKIGKIIPFGTSGGHQIVIKEITEYTLKKGIKVDNCNLYVQMWLKGHSMLGLKGGNLNEKQIKKVKEFVKNVIENN
jgi:flavodoxin